MVDHLEHHVDDEELNDRSEDVADLHLDDSEDIELSVILLIHVILLVLETDRGREDHLRGICEEEGDHAAHPLASIVEVDCLLSHN